MLGHSILVAALDVVAVGQSLVGVHRHIGHVAGGHVCALGKTTVLLRRKVTGARLLGAIDLAGLVNTVIAGGRGLGGVQACL